MRLENNLIILRDRNQADIEDYIRWNTTEIEWTNWDAPWEKDDPAGFDADDFRQKQFARLKKQAALPGRPRDSFEICLKKSNETHIGWVNYYEIDTEANFSDDKPTELYAIGIDLPGIQHRGQGYGFTALSLFINYLLDQGKTELFTQTWSGNHKMIRLAEKLGFELYRRKIGIREVKGNHYDGLTWKLNLAKYQASRA